MAKMMRAGVAHAFKQPLSIEEMPVPTPGPGEVLIKVVASGVCHTDLHAADGDWPVKPLLPFVPGHEGAGFIAACGPGVVGLKEGDRAGVAWLHDACGQCEYCMTGWDSLCYAQHNTGCSACRRTRIWRKWRLSFVPGSPLTKALRKPRHARESGSQSSGSAALANSRFIMPRPWACTSRRWMSPRISLHSPAPQVRM
jgi:Alcohol dehydrogenase GroES-like domain